MKYGYTDTADFIETFKLPFAGYRDYDSSVYGQGGNGGYWSSSPYDDSSSLYFLFDSSNIGQDGSRRAYGLSVRCFKDSYEAPSFHLFFESNSGSPLEPNPQSVIQGTAGEEPDAPTRDGYEFAGWYSDVELTSARDRSTVLTGDTTLYAKWNPKQYAISFDTEGGSKSAPITQDY